MPVSFHVASALRQFSGGRDRIDATGSPATVGEALAILWRLYPGLRDRVVTEQDEIREHVNVFVGRENIRYTGGLATPIADADEIAIFHAVSGG